MLLIGKKIAFGLTSVQYAFNKTIPQISKLISEGAKVIPIMSYDAYNLDSKYGKAKDYIKQIEDIASHRIIQTNDEIDKIDDADIMIICPCSGNSIGKIATGIMDTPVLKMAKKIMRENKNIVIGIATVDGLSRKCGKYRKIIK